MWPFKRKIKEQRARDAPGVTLRTEHSVRGDWTLTTSEAIHAAVGLISTTMAMLPINLMDKDMNILWDDPRQKLMSYMPNGTMTPYVFQQTMEAYRGTEGNAYALIVPDGTGAPHALEVLDASRVKVLRATESREIYYDIDLGDGQLHLLHSSHLIALHHICASGERGIRPVDVLRGSLDYDANIKEFSLKQLSGVNAGVMLTVPNTGLGDPEKQNLINSFLDAYKKSGGRVIVLEGGMTAATLSQSPVDSKVLDVERITKNRVATVYHIPPHMLGDYTDQSYATAEQSKREYLDQTILPIVRMWETELNFKLLTWTEYQKGLRFRFDLEEMLRADTATAAEANFKAVRSGWKKINEARRRDGLPPDPHGDILMVSRDMMPLEAAQKGESI